MKTLLLVATAGSAALVLLAGCQETDRHYSDFLSTRPGAGLRLATFTNQVDPAWLNSPTNFFTLGPGDRLEVELLEDPASKITTVVGPDGKVYFNLLPGEDVWGLTLGQAKTQMEHDLARYIRGTPQINLTLRDVQSKRVWMLGRFQAPGVYNLAGPTTLLEAIAAAGGALTFAGTKESTAGPIGEDLADLNHSFVVRNGKLLPVDFRRLLERGDLSQNIYLQPDDFVYFAPAYARDVYVLGAVTQGRALPYTPGLTLMGAIAGAYGTIQDAYLSHVTIVRGSLSEPQAGIVDYREIITGRKPDIALQPNDIVYVPFSPYRYIRKYVDIALETFVSSVAINAGSRLILPNNTRTVGSGVFIPVGSGVQVIPPPAPPIH